MRRLRVSKVPSGPEVVAGEEEENAEGNPEDDRAGAVDAEVARVESAIGTGGEVGRSGDWSAEAVGLEMAVAALLLSAVGLLASIEVAVLVCRHVLLDVARDTAAGDGVEVGGVVGTHGDAARRGDGDGDGDGGLGVRLSGVRLLTTVTRRLVSALRVVHLHGLGGLLGLSSECECKEERAKLHRSVS